MICAVVGARALGHELPRSKGKHRRRWLPPSAGWILAAWTAAAQSLAACTLTAESFEPSPVDRTDAQLTPAEVSPAPMSVQGSSSGAPTPSGAGEGVPDVRVDPAGVDSPAMDEERLGATPAPGSTASEGNEVSNADADVDVPDAGGTREGDATAPAEPCPSLTFGGSCYELFDEFVGWDVAEERCVAWGGHLASVESSEEDAFLGDWPAQLGVPAADGSALWLGGTDVALDGVFRWSDDTPLSYGGWAPNQPDNGVGLDCIAKRNDGTERWYDHRCTDALRYVCERAPL